MAAGAGAAALPPLLIHLGHDLLVVEMMKTWRMYAALLRRRNSESKKVSEIELQARTISFGWLLTENGHE